MFAFSIGHDNPGRNDKDDMYGIHSWHNMYVYNNHVIFRSDKWTDAIYLKGTRFGNIGGNLGTATLMHPDQQICAVGLLKYSGMNVMTHLRVSPHRDSKIRSVRIPDEEVEVEVSGGDDAAKGNAYQYIKNNLGLRIELAAVGLSSKGVQAMTWLLHKQKGLEFRVEEFKVFWDWLIKMTYESLEATTNCQCCFCIEKEKPSPEEKKNKKTLEEIKKYYEPEFKHLCAIFLEEEIPSENAILLQATNSSEKKQKLEAKTTRKDHLIKSPTPCHIDQGEILIVNTDFVSMYLNKTGVSALVLNGKMIDTSGDRKFTSSGLPSNSKLSAEQILGDILSQALSKKILIQECVSIHGHKTKYVGAEHGEALVCLFTRMGANMVLRDEDMDDWTIYNISAQKLTVGGMIDMAICAVLQILGPILLAVFSITNDEMDGQQFLFEPLTGSDWTSRILTSFLLLYLFAWNHKLLTSSDSERKLNFFLILLLTSKRHICARNVVLFGFIVNTLTYFLVCMGSVIILIYTDDPIDIVLNSLALLFLKDIDSDLVDDEFVNSIQTQAQSELSTFFSSELKNVFAGDGASHQNIAILADRFKGRFSNFTWFSKFLVRFNMVMLLVVSILVLIFKVVVPDSEETQLNATIF